MLKNLKNRKAIKTSDKKYYIEDDFKKNLFSTSLSSNFTSSKAHEINLNLAIKENHLLENAEFSFGPKKLIAKYDRIDCLNGNRSNYLELVNAASQETLKEWIILYSNYLKVPLAVAAMCTLFDDIYGDHDEGQKTFLSEFLGKEHVNVYEIAFASLFKFNLLENNLYLVQDDVFEHRKEQLLMQISVMCELSDTINMPNGFSPWHYNHGDKIFKIADILVSQLERSYLLQRLTDEQIKVLQNG